jgi:hypothetical protein
LLLGILLIGFVSRHAYYTQKYKTDDQDISTHTIDELIAISASELISDNFNQGL